MAAVGDGDAVVEVEAVAVAVVEEGRLKPLPRPRAELATVMDWRMLAGGTEGVGVWWGSRSG